MAHLHLQQPWAVGDLPRGLLLCLPSDERMDNGFSATKGQLSDNRHVEAFLQGLLLFGPPAFLLIGAPIRIFQLYRSKLVIKPNYRGILKSVSRERI